MFDLGSGFQGLKSWADVQQQLSQWAAATDPVAAQAALVDHYRRLFTPSFMPEATATDTGTTFIRCQLAAERFGRQATAIAFDASERFRAALSAAGPQAPPITSPRRVRCSGWYPCGTGCPSSQSFKIAGPESATLCGT